jgi:hypothetical protein
MMTPKYIVLAIVGLIVASGIVGYDYRALYSNITVGPAGAPRFADIVAAIQLARTQPGQQAWVTVRTDAIAIAIPPTGFITKPSPTGIAVFADTKENRAYLASPDEYESSRPGLYLSRIVGETDPMQVAKTNFPELPHATARFGDGDAAIIQGQGADAWDTVIFRHHGVVYQAVIQYGTPDEPQRAAYYRIIAEFAL